MWLFSRTKGGYQQLYVMRNGKAQPLMEGQFEVYSPFQRGGQWYFHANLQNPGIRHFYRLDGKRPVQLTQGDGFHDAFFVGDILVDMASESNRPPYVKVRQGEQGWRELYDGRSKAFKSYPWRVPEFVTFPNDDGSEVYARLYRPQYVQQRRCGIYPWCRLPPERTSGLERLFSRVHVP